MMRTFADSNRPAQGFKHQRAGLRRSLWASCAVGLVATCYVGCGDDDPDHQFLGPIDAGTGAPDSAEAGADAQVEPREVTALTSTACATSPIVTSSPVPGVLDLGAHQGRLVVTLPDGLVAMQLGPDGCPTTRIDSFGEQGLVKMQALAASPLEAGRTLVATPSSTVVLDSAGNALGSSSCELDGKPLVVRLLDIGPSGKGLAVFTRSPIVQLSTQLESPYCQAQQLPLNPAPFAIIAMSGAAAWAGDVVTVEQSEASSALMVARYNQAGDRIAILGGSPDPTDPSHICSATGIVGTIDGPIVIDASCKRATLYPHDITEPVRQVALSGSPRAITLLSNGRTALVAVASEVPDGAVVSFVRMPGS